MSDNNTPPLPEGSVVITPTEMYREMQDIGRKVDHLTSVLDPWQSEINRRIDANRDQIEAERTERIREKTATDTQLRQLHNWRWFLAGIGAIAGPGTAVAIKFLP